MSKSVLIIGGKPSNYNLRELFEKYDIICRINFNMKYKKKTEKDIFFLNNHLYFNTVKQRTKPEELKKHPYSFVDLKVSEDFHNMLNNNEYGEIIKQYESGRNKISNGILEKLKCPHKFLKAPRCGYQAILYFLMNNYDVTIFGFSRENNNDGTYYNDKKPSSAHDFNSEMKILNWLIENKIIKIIE